MRCKTVGLICHRPLGGIADDGGDISGAVIGQLLVQASIVLTLDKELTNHSAGDIATIIRNAA